MQIMTTAQDSAKSNPEKAQLLDNYSGNWIWRAVECLVKSKDFNPSPKWIADRLSISIENAVDAIEGLEKLRLITRTSTGFAATGNITLLGVEQTTK